MHLRAMPPPAAVTGIILVAGLGFCLAANWPGHLSYDSVIQLLEGRRGVYANWHPPVMSWLLGLSDAVSPGAALFVVFDTLLIYGALAALLWTTPARSWAAPILAAAILATPQFALYPAIVWKDVLCAAASVMGFVCLALSARLWPAPVSRMVLIAAGFLLFVLAALARQNGALILLAGAVTLAWIAIRQEGARRGVVLAAAVFGAALVVAFAGQAALGLRVEGDLGPAAQFRLLETYDMVGALARDPALPLPEIHTADPGLEHLMRTDGVRLYTPERNDTMAKSDDLTDAYNHAPYALVTSAWSAMIFDHPWLYLKTRWAAFDWVFLTPDLRRCVPFDLGVDGPAETMKALHMPSRWDDRDEALSHYAGLYIGTPVLSHAFFAVVGVAALVLLLRRRRDEDIAIAGLLIGALLFTASFFVISIACDYRYLLFLDIAAMSAAFYVCLDPVSFLRSEGRAASSPPV
jgi:hypothetical protein